MKSIALGISVTIFMLTVFTKEDNYIGETIGCFVTGILITAIFWGI